MREDVGNVEVVEPVGPRWSEQRTGNGSQRMTSSACSTDSLTNPSPMWCAGGSHICSASRSNSEGGWPLATSVTGSPHFQAGHGPDGNDPQTEHEGIQANRGEQHLNVNQWDKLTISQRYSSINVGLCGEANEKKT